MWKKNLEKENCQSSLLDISFAFKRNWRNFEESKKKTC